MKGYVLSNLLLNSAPGPYRNKTLMYKLGVTTLTWFRARSSDSLFFLHDGLSDFMLTVPNSLYLNPTSDIV